MPRNKPFELASHGFYLCLPIELKRIVSGFPNTLPPQDLKGLELGRVGVCVWAHPFPAAKEHSGPGVPVQNGDL